MKPYLMPLNQLIKLWVAGLVLLLPASPAHAEATAKSLAQQVQEILSERCWSCHGERPKAKLDLRSVEAIKSRRVDILAGMDEAQLLQMIVGQPPRMPKGREPLAERQVEVIRQWILAGAPDFPTTNLDHYERDKPRQWWAFEPVHAPDIPASDAHPIDALVQTRQQALGVRPVPRADRRVLIRRAYADLHGLPPTPQDVEQFVKDAAPNAFANLVDRLLESPRYGERWGRHWLDVVRYADTGGFETDIYFPNAWRYRDYVIKSWNDDKSFQQFMREQIAGDELWPDDLELRGTFDIPASKQAHLEARIGTGIFHFGPVYHEAALNGHQLRYEWMTDAVDTVGEAFLGLTITCARCHDHKFDPLTQRDYHRLMDVFAGSAIRHEPVVHKMSEFGFYAAYPQRRRLEELRDQIQAIDVDAKARAVDAIVSTFPREARVAYLKPAQDRKAAEMQLVARIEEALSNAGLRENADGRQVAIPLTDEERSRRDELIRLLGETALRASLELPTATVLGRADVVYPVHMTVRGDYRQTGERVCAGVPAIFSGGKEVTFAGWKPDDARGRRSALADWLADPLNPLVARVIVNRLWQGHFGRGLVTTPNNFGLQSDLPVLAELLDYLAARFVADGWSLKRMHRLIMTSEAYQRSTQFDADNAKLDLENLYLWRMNRRRLEAEAIRDHVLAAAGTLNLKMGGEPVVVPLTDEEKLGMWALDQWPETLDLREHTRRSVYLYVKRSFPLPMFTTFDSPDTSVSCGRRDTTTVAPQALTLLNSRFLMDQAEHFADRVLSASGPESEDRIRYAWRVALSREPTQRELSAALALVTAEEFASRGQPRAGDTEVRERFTRLTLAIFNLNEFVYVD